MSTSTRTTARPEARTSRRGVFVALLISALLVAGVVSYAASSHPDGLERVGADLGFLDTAEEGPAADGPLADYQTRGVEDPRLSGGLAGVTGALLVLVIVGALTLLLRRRSGPRSGAGESARSGAGPGPDADSGSG